MSQHQDVVVASGGVSFDSGRDEESSCDFNGSDKAPSDQEEMLMPIMEGGAKYQADGIRVKLFRDEASAD